jgi:CYTH domain-containing protein
MAEIEKKFLLSDDNSTYISGVLKNIYPTFEELVTDVNRNGMLIRQGYLTAEEGAVLTQMLCLNPTFDPTEARLRNKDGSFFFTLKGNGTVERDELEIPISRETFNLYWPQTKGKRVEKIRLKKTLNNYLLEIDFYLDRELVVVEVEVGSREEAENFPALGKDITNDKNYKNKNLAK